MCLYIIYKHRQYEYIYCYFIFFKNTYRDIENVASKIITLIAILNN